MKDTTSTDAAERNAERCVNAYRDHKKKGTNR